MLQPENKVQIANVQKPKMKRTTLILLIILGVVVIGAGVAGYFYYVKKGSSNTALKIQDQTVASKLDGLKVAKDKANRHPLAIIIENHPDARPQIGLAQASIVYEAISEGGITRFMAVYGPEDAEKVGPVRSARTYFVDWASSFNAFYAHCGGNLDALDKIKADKILDLDQFALGDAAYWREPQAGKASEHTLYTSTAKLYQAAQEKGWSPTGDFTALKFREPVQTATTTSTSTTPTAATPVAPQKITVDFSSPTYRVDWQYDAASNSYLRSMAGSIHKDAASGGQLSVKNIIVQEVERSEAITAINEQGYAMKTVGEGKAKIFIENTMIEGTWKKPTRTDRTLFYDSTGKEIEFIPGHFWIEIAPPEVFDKIQVGV